MTPPTPLASPNPPPTPPPLNRQHRSSSPSPNPPPTPPPQPTPPPLFRPTVAKLRSDTLCRHSPTPSLALSTSLIKELEMEIRYPTALIILARTALITVVHQVG